MSGPETGAGDALSGPAAASGGIDGDRDPQSPREPSRGSRGDRGIGRRRGDKAVDLEPALCSVCRTTVEVCRYWISDLAQNGHHGPVRVGTRPESHSRECWTEYRRRREADAAKLDGIDLWDC